MDDEGFLAMALDGDKRPVRSAGHLDVEGTEAAHAEARRLVRRPLAVIRGAFTRQGQLPQHGHWVLRVYHPRLGVMIGPTHQAGGGQGFLDGVVGVSRTVDMRDGSSPRRVADGLVP